MQSQEFMNANAEDVSTPGKPVLFYALLCGVISGTASNVTALLLGYSFWIGLLCHSLVGMLGMLLVIAAYLVRGEKVGDDSAS